MANIKISELTALNPPDAADLAPVTDSSANHASLQYSYDNPITAREFPWESKLDSSYQ